MRNHALRAGLLVCCLGGAVVCAQAPQAPPTIQQIHEMMDGKGYRPALRAISQILPSAPNTPGGDKYNLLMLRGECLVQVKDSATALIAYGQAATAAGTLAQNEAATAMGILIQRSPGLIYTPRTGDRAPLDITDLAARKRAMVALLNDLLPGIGAQVNDALNANSLPPIFDVGRTLRDLHSLEMVATGEDKQTIALIQPLADRVYTLINGELNRVNAQVQGIQRAAAATVQYGGGSFSNANGIAQWVPSDGMTGLSDQNRQALRDAQNYLSQIGQTCNNLSAVARRYDRDGQRWQTLAGHTTDILNFVNSVYDHE